MLSLSLALVLGPWLSLRTKLQSLVLALALNLQSLVLSLALKVSPWSSPWTPSPWLRLSATSTLQLSANPTHHYRCFGRSLPASSLFWATFCVRRLRLHLWSICSLGVNYSCVQIEHACPTLCWKLWSSLNATVLFVCDVAQWRVYAPELNTDELISRTHLTNC